MGSVLRWSTDGIASPIIQNRNHIQVLQQAFDDGLIEPKKRLGITIKPLFRSVVLVSNDARISRPRSKAAAARVDGLDTVIKVEMLESISKDMDARSLVNISRVVSSDTIVRLATDLVALHRPATVDWAANSDCHPLKRNRSRNLARGRACPASANPVAHRSRTASPGIARTIPSDSRAACCACRARRPLSSEILGGRRMTHSMFSNLFTYARSNDVRQLENFTTEAFAASTAWYRSPSRASWTHGIAFAARPNQTVLVSTQEVVSGVGIVDLVARAIDGSDIEAEVWVEAKVWAAETGDQLSRYQRHLAAR